MHGHHRNIHLLVGARRKKRVDDSVRRHFARSDEEKSRRPLLEEQFFERCQLAENRLANFGRQPARKTFEPLSYLKKSCPVHCFATLHRYTVTSDLRFKDSTIDLPTNLRKSTDSRVGIPQQSAYKAS